MMMEWLSAIGSFFNAIREFLCSILKCDSCAGKSVKQITKGKGNSAKTDSHDSNVSGEGNINITINYAQASTDIRKANPMPETASAPLKGKELKEVVNRAEIKTTNEAKDFRQLTDTVKGVTKDLSDFLKKQQQEQ